MQVTDVLTMTCLRCTQQVDSDRIADPDANCFSNASNTINGVNVLSYTGLLIHISKRKSLDVNI